MFTSAMLLSMAGCSSPERDFSDGQSGSAGVGPEKPGSGGSSGVSGAGGSGAESGGGSGGSLSCSQGQTRCAQNSVQACDSSGSWETLGECVNQTCFAGTCTGTCAPGQTRCSSSEVQSCNVNGQWATTATCADQTCVDGACVGACAPGQTRCSGGALQTCGPDGDWGAEEACPAAVPLCAAGACVTPPSCEGLPLTCAGESCCASSLVPGGTFNRFNDASYPARVSGFRLDKYEVTVGRFRRFVNAVLNGWRPATGAGKHTHLNGGQGLATSGDAGGYEAGWDSSWNAHLHANKATWDGSSLACSRYSTWTPDRGSNESLPANCVSWPQAFAFCIWDGGFLPSEAEWNYAAAGGSDQRPYAWGATAPGANDDLAVYGCYYNGAGSCSAGVFNIAAVGSIVPDTGKFGQLDLGGNVAEWTSDQYSGQPDPACDDCVEPGPSSYDRVTRGGAFFLSAEALLTSHRFSGGAPHLDLGGVGFRCARTP